MDGLTEVKAKLLDTAAVVAVVGTYKTKPAIYGVPVVPGKFAGDAISMYISAPTNGGMEFLENTITVNSFSKTRKAAVNMQNEVFNALNRSAESDDTFFRCSKLIIIDPQSTGGDYNAPVEVLTRQR